jgi:phosphopantothenoylcysteine synthetase/decarboxylase
MEATTFERSIANYRKVGIEIEVLENKYSIPVVLIKQTRLINGFILNQKQLVTRAKKVFAPQKIHARPAVFSLNVSHISADWITSKQKEYNIKTTDLVKQLAINKITLKKILQGSLSPSIHLKAAFYYYFLVFELNNLFRETA